jgi:hypothetical protein
MTGAEMTLAKYYSKQAVKELWKRQGIKLAHCEASELNQAALVYLTDHPELIAFASQRYRYFVESGQLRRPRTRRKPSQ